VLDEWVLDLDDEPGARFGHAHDVTYVVQPRKPG
jgi:hypothetical protein